ncbi:MAG: translocation/assembly module TamB domain-containing protein, partial [bacterium]
PLQRLDLMIDGDTFLAPLKRLFKSIEAIKGKGSFVLSIRGQWETPLINGGITFQDASLGIKDFPYRMYDLKSYLYIDDNRFVIEDLSGKIGGGDMSLRGYGYVKGFTVDKFYLDTELHDVTFKFTRGFMTTLSGNLVYRGDQGKYTLVGQAAILQARYTERIDWGAQILKSRVQEKPKGTLTPFQQTELNIKVDGDKNIVIDNNIARTSLKLDLLLRGTVAKPILFGRIETEKGSVYFRKNKFDIIHASADFIDQEKINPYYDISALTVVKGYNIRITLEGQLERFNLALLSDPPLDQTDILSLLTVGEVGSGKKKGIEGEMGTSEATSFITSAYQNAVEERLTSITGFDRFEVEPYIQDKTGSISPKFTVAKRLIGDKLYLTYSSTVGTDQADVIKVEYQLDKNTSLVGFQESTGSLGGDIKFRFEFR